MSEAFEFYSKGLRAMLGLAITRTVQQMQAVGHRWTYRQTASPKNVVIVGGSYAGTYLAQRLTETLPTGYRAVLVEKNSHFNHLFVFPRFGVVPGKEHMAFVPYDSLASDAPPGIFQHVHDSATTITPNQVHLASGQTIDYEYLALATGSWQPPPSRAVSTDKADACAELRASQKRIHDASRIAIIGGGPVGIQIAADIKSYFPSKDVTLIHSRPQLLPNFGPRLHEYALQGLKSLQVKVMLGERPQLVPKGIVDSLATSKQMLAFKNGEKVGYDLVIPCTGQRPNSDLIARLMPAAICPTTRQILVRPTLQVDDKSNPSPRIFALGDVAKTNGPRMARSGRAQADVVTSNILAMINRRVPSTLYHPALYENSIKLYMGKADWAFYCRVEHGRELMVTGKENDENLNVNHAWSNLGARFEPTPA